MAWSISLVNLDQLAFFRLKRLLKVQCVAVTGDLMVIVIVSYSVNSFIFTSVEQHPVL